MKGCGLNETKNYDRAYHRSMCFDSHRDRGVCLSVIQSDVTVLSVKGVTLDIHVNLLVLVLPLLSKSYKIDFF